MPTTYEKADPDVMDVITETVRKYHQSLLRAHVTIQAITAHNNNKGGAVKLHGWPCLATIRRTTLKQRAAGNADAEILIDGDEWENLSESQRVALIDHELTHLEVADGDTDDLGRPRITIRLHDYELGGFREVMQRHGPDAAETAAATKWHAEYEQLLLSFATA